jgi:hypothetical protein
MLAKKLGYNQRKAYAVGQALVAPRSTLISAAYVPKILRELRSIRLG